MRRILASAALPLLLFQACSRETAPVSDAGTVRVRASVSVDGGGRSSMIAGENEVKTFLILAYGPEGLLESQAETGNQELELRLGVGYRVYAMINMGDLDAGDFRREEDAVSFRFDGAPDDMRRNGIPAAGSTGCIFHAGDRYELSLPCRRLLSRYDISLSRNYSDTSASFVVTEVGIRQSSCLVTPFIDGYAAKSPEDLMEGDRASEDDIAVLNDLSFPETGKVSFYMFENMQGVPASLESNEDPWRKTPENAAEIASLATFLEIKGRYRSLAGEGTVTYRVYLGRNAFSDFNVERNVNYSLALRLTDEGLCSGSWKADAAVEYETWEPDGVEFILSSPTQEFASCVAGGRIIWYDGSGEEHNLDNRHLSGMEIRAGDADGNDVTSFTEFRFKGDGNWEMEFNTPEMKALGVTDGGLTYRISIIYDGEVYDEQEIVFYEIIDSIDSAVYTCELNGRGVHPYGILSLAFNTVCSDGKPVSVPYGYEGHDGWQYFHLGSESLEHDLIWGSHPDPDAYLQGLQYFLRTYEHDWISADVCIVDSSSPVDIPFRLYDIRQVI